MIQDDGKEKQPQNEPREEIHEETAEGRPQDESARLSEAEAPGVTEIIQPSPLPVPSVPGNEYAREHEAAADAAGLQGKEEQKQQTYWRLVTRQYRKNRPAVIGLYLILFLVFLALFANFLANDKPIFCKYQGEFYSPVFREFAVNWGGANWNPVFVDQNWKDLDYDMAIWPPVPYTATEIDGDHPLAFPFDMEGHSHVLGTDQLGRDILAGLIHGAQTSLWIGLVAMGIATIIGVILGALAGYYGGWVDIIISRLIEIFLNFPSFFLIITLVAFLADSYPDALIYLIMVVIGLTGWMGIARLTRGEVLRVRNMEYVTAADALGFSGRRVIFRHVLPNSLAPVLVAVAFGIASAILTEAALSFLGFGVAATEVTWGSMLSEARGNAYAWWLAVFPGLLIFLTVLAYNLVGDGLRDATDPRLKI